MQNDQNSTSISSGSQLPPSSPPSTSISKSQLMSNFRSSLFQGKNNSSDQTVANHQNLANSVSATPQLSQTSNDTVATDLEILDEVISEVESQSEAQAPSQPFPQPPNQSTVEEQLQPQPPTQTQPEQLLQSQVEPPIQSQPQTQDQQPIAQFPQSQPQPSISQSVSQPQSDTQPPQYQPPTQAQQPASQPQPLPPQEPSIFSQALPLAVTQVADQQAQQNLNPPSPTPAGLTGKEKIELKTPDSVVIDANSGIQVVEQEPNPELPPEVDGFLKKSELQEQQKLQEIIIADGSVDVSQQKSYPSQPVVVLPITEETEKKARFKGPAHSIRWLVEWSHKMIKKFVGKVIYRQT